MNPDQPSREQIETRITALLLGELPADEAALLRYTIAQDPALKQLHDELQSTLVLVREAAKNPGEPALARSAPLQLSGERRQKLLTHFKTPRPHPAPQEPLFWLKPIRKKWRIPALVVLAHILVVAAILVPILTSGRRTLGKKFQAMSLSMNGSTPPDLQYRTRREGGESSQEMQPVTREAGPEVLPVQGQPTPANEPALITHPPESQPAQAPASILKTQIVLPQMESASEVSAPAGAVAESEGLSGFGNRGIASPTVTIARHDMGVLAGATVAAPNPAAAGTPVELTLPPEPELAPPPGTLPSTAPSAPIVLPPMELARRLADQSAATSQVYSQNIVGFVAIPPSNGVFTLTPTVEEDLAEVKPPAPTTPPAQPQFDSALAPQANDRLAIREPAPTQWVVPGQEAGGPKLADNQFNANYQFLGAPAGAAQNLTFNPGTGGAGAVETRAARPQAVVQKLPGSAAIALDDSRANRSSGGFGGFGGRGGFRGSQSAQGSPATSTLGASTVAAAASAAPMPAPIAAPAPASLAAPAIASDRIANVGLLEPNNATVEREASKNLAPEVAGKTVPILGDVSVLGNLLQNSKKPKTSASPPVAATAAPIPVGGTIDLAEREQDVNVFKLKSANPRQAAQVPQGMFPPPAPQTPREATLVTLTNDYSSSAEVSHLRTSVDQLEHENDVRTTGNKTGLETEMNAKNADIEARDASVKAAEVKSQKELHINGESEAAQPAPERADQPIRKPAPNAPVPQPEILASSNAFSTFSLNVSDVSFKYAEASLQNNRLPNTASIRSEEFINAFDYRDPEAAEGQPMAFASERARYPFAHNRELLRFAIKTAAAGRQPGRALNLVLLLDVSGSMERADRVGIIHEALRVLATQLKPQDTVSVVTFSRTAHLWADGISGDKAGATLARVGGITPEGGTNLEEAMRLAYETAHRHYLANGMNRVELLTDGAANLGNVEPEVLRQNVEAQRRQGIALDCFGIGWEDYNDDLLEQLSSHGDGRYAFLNSPEDAAKEFAAKLAGALQIAAADVKVQVEFNPARVIAYRQIGYATHQLTKEQFRDNTVPAGEIAAQEAGNALYTIETNPGGDGPIATVHVRYRIPGTKDYREHSWDVAYTGSAPALEGSSPAMRLAATASAFSEWLAASPYAQEVTLEGLLKILSGVPEIYGADDRPKQLETMIREAQSSAGVVNGF